MVYLAMMLGKASKYEVISKGCIPVGLMLKGIYGSTSVTGVLSFLQRRVKWLKYLILSEKNAVQKKETV
jgi:hypothetical protein